MKKTAKASVLAAVVSLCQTTSASAQESPQAVLVQEVIPDHLAYLYAPSSDATSKEVARQLSAAKRRWENGRTLRVCFYNGNAAVVALIRSVASQWNDYSGVVLDFGAADQWFNCLDPRVGFPQIRVGFSERGYWSYIGSDSERYGGERAPSMNFDSFHRIYSEVRYTAADVVKSADPSHKAAIRHEFGHALGLLHEHQNPNLHCREDIKWTGPKNVYDYFLAPPNEWSASEVDRNLGFIGATDPDYVEGAPDPKSIMMYALPAHILKSGAASPCAAAKNTELSDKDKQIVAALYPKDGKETTPRRVDESLTAAYVKAPPRFAAPDETAEFVSRVVVDLESDDVATRRNARTRLAQMLQQDIDVQRADSLILAMSAASYRYKLGLAVALANAKRKVEVSPSSATVIEQQIATEKDATLQENLQAARKNIDTQRAPNT
jgi:hypothetical protein